MIKIPFLCAAQRTNTSSWNMKIEVSINKVYMEVYSIKITFLCVFSLIGSSVKRIKKPSTKILLFPISLISMYQP